MIASRIQLVLVMFLMQADLVPLLEFAAPDAAQNKMEVEWVKVRRGSE